MPVTWLPAAAQMAVVQARTAISPAFSDDSRTAPGAPESEPGRRSKYVTDLAEALAGPSFAQQVTQRQQQQPDPTGRLAARDSLRQQAAKQATRSSSDFKQALRDARSQPPSAAPVDSKPTSETPQTPVAQPEITEALESKTESKKADFLTLEARPAVADGGKSPVSDSMATDARTPAVSNPKPAAAAQPTSASGSTNTFPAAPPPMVPPPPQTPSTTGTTSSVTVTSGVETAGASGHTNGASAAGASSALELKPITEPRANSDGGPSGEAAVSPESALTDGEGDDGAGNIDRIVHWVRSLNAGGRTHATLRLDPPNLGTLKLHLNLEKDRLTVHMQPDNAAAHEMLSRHIDELRARLAAGGLTLTQVQIAPPLPPTDGQGATAFSQPQAQGGRQGGQAAAERRAERVEDAAPVAESGASPVGGTSIRSAAESRVNLVA